MAELACQASVEKFGWRFQIRDKVIQTENNYEKEVFNGDIGTIEQIDPIEHEVAIRFEDRLVKYDYGELDEISLAYNHPTFAISSTNMNINSSQFGRIIFAATAPRTMQFGLRASFLTSRYS